MLEIMFQCWKLLSIFLLILDCIDHIHVKICFSLKTVKISTLDMLLPILDETRTLPMLENIVYFLLIIEHVAPNAG